MEKPLTPQEGKDLIRRSTRILTTKKIEHIQTMMVTSTNWDDTAYAQWITTDPQLVDTKWTIRRNKVTWNIWKNAVIRDYEALVIIEDTGKTPGEGGAYTAAGKRAFIQMKWAICLDE